MSLAKSQAVLFGPRSRVVQLSIRAPHHSWVLALGAARCPPASSATAAESSPPRSHVAPRGGRP
eukprot:30616-Alexandrium_andersonii.AAC.1